MNDQVLRRLYFGTFCVTLILIVLGNRINWFPYISYALPFLVLTIYLAFVGKWDILWNVLGNKVIYNIVLVAFVSSWVVRIIVKYYSFSYNIWDTGIFANSILNFVHRGTYYSSILQLPQLSDHFCPNLLLLAPIFWFFPNAIVLIWVRFAGMVYSIFLIGPLCKLYGIEDRAINFFRLIWILNLGIFGVLSYEFQPSSLVIPFIFLLFIFYKKGEYVKLVCCSLFILGFKEQTCVIIIFFGSYIFFAERRYWRGLLVGISGFLAGLLVFFVITPWITGLSNIHQSYFDPLANWSDKLGFLWLSLKTTGLMPILFGVQYFFVVLPGLAFNLVTNQISATTFGFHYQDISSTVIFVASIAAFGLAEKNLQRGNFYKVFFSISICLALTTNSKFPTFEIGRLIPTENQQLVFRKMEEFKKSPFSDYELYTQDCIGFYFTEKYKLSTFGMRNIDQNVSHCILMADGLNPWPLKEVNSEIQHFQELVDKGEYTQLKEFYPLFVFVKTVK